MSPLRRACLGCGQLTDRSRCPACQRERERARPQRPTNLTRTPDERARRAAVVDVHRAQVGDWCPGWGDREAHDVAAPNRLSADHVIPIAAGGDPGGPLQVLCLSCNGAKGARTAATVPPPCCVLCGRTLLLTRPGRDTCARCDIAHGINPHQRAAS